MAKHELTITGYPAPHSQPQQPNQPAKTLHTGTCACGWSETGFARPARARHAFNQHVAYVDRALPCPTPDKTAFRDRHAAERGLDKVIREVRRKKLPTRSYLCRCGAWHLTSRPRNRYHTVT